MADGADNFIYIRIPNESSSGKGLSTGAIVGIIIACAVVENASVIIAILLCRRSAKSSMQTNKTKVFDPYFDLNKNSQNSQSDFSK